MEQGPTERQIVDRCVRERLPLPKRIQNAPELLLGLELYYGAFLDLSSCRPNGWGPQPISWLTIAEYADHLGLDEEQREDLFFFIRAMDSCWLHYHDRKQKQEQKIRESRAVRKTNPTPRQ